MANNQSANNNSDNKSTDLSEEQKAQIISIWMG